MKSFPSEANTAYKAARYQIHTTPKHEECTDTIYICFKRQGETKFTNRVKQKQEKFGRIYINKSLKQIQRSRRGKDSAKTKGIEYSIHNSNGLLNPMAQVHPYIITERQENPVQKENRKYYLIKARHHYKTSPLKYMIWSSQCFRNSVHIF